MINLASFVTGSNKNLFMADDALYIHLLDGNYSQDALLSRVFLLLRQVRTLSYSNFDHAFEKLSNFLLLQGKS